MRWQNPLLPWFAGVTPWSPLGAAKPLAQAKETLRASSSPLVKVFSAVLSSALLLSSCTPVSDSYPTLVNEGALALSTTNPYLGANLFLSHELERSRYLFNFFKSRGAPVAIEIIQPSVGATRLLLYYPNQREVFAADLVQEATKREWIVRGPFEIERQDYRTLIRLDASMAGEPVFEIYGKPFRFRFNSALEKTTAPRGVLTPTLPEVPPTPVATPKPKVKRPVITAKAPSEPTPPPVPTIDIYKPLNADQQALLAARGFARRDTNGDVLHVVKGENQTLERVVRWYTGGPAAVGEVAKLNSLPEQENLPTGTTVKIPVKLVKERKAMP